MTPLTRSILERANISQGTTPSGSLTPIQAEVDTAVSEFFGPSHGSPVSNFTELDRISGRINQAGAVLGFLSLMASFSNRTRPFATAGIRLLSSPTVSALLLASGGYSLVRQAPQTLQAGLRIFGSYDDNSRHSRTRDLLEVAGFGVGTLGILVGVGSFVAGGKNFLTTRQALIAKGREALIEQGMTAPLAAEASSTRALGALGLSPRMANQEAYIHGDTVRRAFQDPDTWVTLARGSARLTALERSRILRAASLSQWTLLGGSALVGSGRFAYGIHDLYQNQERNGRFSPLELGGLLVHVAMDVSPGVTMLLYRGARGDTQVAMEPAMSQKLTQASYHDPDLRGVVLDKTERGIPRLPPRMEKEFITQSHEELRRVEILLHDAEALPVQQNRGRQEPLNGAHSPSSIPPERLYPTAALSEAAAPRLPSHEIGHYTFAEWFQAYSSGRLTPTKVLQMIVDYPAAQNGALFPRPLNSGVLGRRLRQLARESERRYADGNPRPLEGIFIAVKDLFPGVDGLMNVGSKTSRIAGIEPSPVVETLLEMGAIPVPVGMTAAANGGSGLHSGYGYIPHPLRDGFDPAGSSSAGAHLVGLPFFPISAAVGSDTGGSVIAPAGAVGLFGFVPPSGVISTKNMVPFATFLDRVGIIARHAEDGMSLARTLSRAVGDDPHMRYENPGMLYQPSASKPRVVYLQDLLNAASAEAQAHFNARVESLKAQGHEVVSLGPEWNFLSEVPMTLYPMDAYPAAAFTHTNPFRSNPFEPPRRTLDENLLVRLPKAAISLRFGLFDRARSLNERYRQLVNEKLGEDIVLASPSPESVVTEDLFAGRAGARLDGHDRITMPKNRIPEWGQLNLPSSENQAVGMTATGSLPALIRFFQAYHGTEGMPVTGAQPGGPRPDSSHPPAPGIFSLSHLLGSPQPGSAPRAQAGENVPN